MLFDNILCGKTISEKIINNIKKEISIIYLKFVRFPKLAIIQVGYREDSKSYIEIKTVAAKRCGIEVLHISLPRETLDSEIRQQIEKLNADISVNGIMFLLPPDSTQNLSVESLINVIHPDKDVDGLTALQMSRLVNEDFLHPQDRAMDDNFLTHLPCAAIACYLLLKHTGAPLLGSRCLLIGHGRLIGSPLASLLLRTTPATITICQEGTNGLEKEVRDADIVISCTGKPDLVMGEWIHPGSVVIDCGISIIIDESTGQSRSVGDVEFDTAVQRARWITPVPGGVGPVCVAMLLRNTLNSFKKSLGLPTHNPLPDSYCYETIK